MHRFVEPTPVHSIADMRAVDEILARNAKIAAQETEKGRKRRRK